MRFFFYFFFFLLITIPAWACESTARTGAPVTQTVGISICRSGYEMLYRPEYKTAYWVAEHIEAHEVSGKLERADKFRPDPLIPDQLEAQLSDYKGSGYARGHLAPVGNFRNNDLEAEESFYLTNMVPQWQKCNNAGVWSVIERVIRDWSVHYGELYVVTGPVYQGPVRTIGNGVRVPDSLFKVIWNPQLNSKIGFVVPNSPVCQTKPRDFMVSVEHVEFLTGIKFFPAVKAESLDRLWN